MFNTVINIIWLWVNATKKELQNLLDERIKLCTKETVFVPTKTNEVAKNRAGQNKASHLIGQCKDTSENELETYIL